MSQVQQHHVTSRHSPGNGINADQVPELTRAKGCSSAGGHAGLTVRIGRGSRSFLREMEAGLLIIVPTGPTRCSRKMPHLVAPFSKETYGSRCYFNEQSHLLRKARTVRGLFCEQSLLILGGQQVRPLNLGRIELCSFESGETIRVVWWAGCAPVVHPE